MTRIDADFKPFSMYTLPLQWSNMSIGYTKSKFLLQQSGMATRCFSTPILFIPKFSTTHDRNEEINSI